MGASEEDAAFLANYVGGNARPFNTTENLTDGSRNRTGSMTVSNSGLIVRYGLFFPMTSTTRFFVSDPTDYAFEACLESHSLVESLLPGGRGAMKGLNFIRTILRPVF